MQLYMIVLFIVNPFFKNFLIHQIKFALKSLSIGLCGLIAILVTILELKFTCRECVWVIYDYFASELCYLQSFSFPLTNFGQPYLHVAHRFGMATFSWTIQRYYLFFSFLFFFSPFFWWLGGLVVFEISHRLLGFRVVKFLYDNVCIKNGCKTCMFKLG